jgi:hypothetical protein
MELYGLAGDPRVSAMLPCYHVTVERHLSAAASTTAFHIGIVSVLKTAAKKAFGVQLFSNPSAYLHFCYLPL